MPAPVGHREPTGSATGQALVAPISAERGTTRAAVAPAWLVGRPGVASVLAGARDLDQLEGLLPVMEMRLTAEEAEALTSASA